MKNQATTEVSHEASWHAVSEQSVLEGFAVDPTVGLTSAEVLERRKSHGENRLVEYDRKSAWLTFRDQFTSPLVALLIVAAGVLFYPLGDYREATAILVIVVLNAALGFYQERRAENAMAALKRLIEPQVRVRRDGRLVEIAAHDVVPGDIVLLEAGDAVPADGRLLESVNLRTQEAALTGESAPVDKQADTVCARDAPLAERPNSVFLGTSATYGRGTLIITSTGMETELGHIATMMQTVAPEPTPLQRRLARLGRTLALLVLALIAVIFGIGLLTSEATDTEVLKILFLTAVSMAVAAVPEGLPAVVTIGLALGAQRMLRRDALIRRLPAVETLGSVTTICSDKTGTLTSSVMQVRTVIVAGAADELSDEHPESRRAEPGLLLALGSLCNDATVEPENTQNGAGENEESATALGDPTETAILSAALRLGMHKHELDDRFPRVEEVPFTSERKRMTTVHVSSAPAAADTPLAPILDVLDSPRHLVVSKGAVDSLLETCTHVWNEGVETLDAAARQRIQDAHDTLASNGMRVLGVAVRPCESVHCDPRKLEQGMIFVGQLGMIDPPRSGVPEAVATCKAAGIRTIMITGDHPLTARYIAEEVGIDASAGVLSGQDLEALDDTVLQATAKEVSVYARVAPHHKLRLVSALEKEGEVVAMTGDGVNDAPALKQADIGIAMGITGTDVAKEAADAVLRDDNFTTIVAAVREGRVVYDNIRKFIRYSLTSNTGEILVMLLAPLLGMPLPLLPLQILWINLVTDGLPGLALAVEPGERNTMQRPPHSPKAGILDRRLGFDILWIGCLMGVVSLGAGYVYWSSSHTHDPQDLRWRTIVFTVLTLSQMGNALAIRSSHDSLLRIGLLTNRPLIASVLLTFGLQLLLIYDPWFGLPAIFSTTRLSATDLGICLLLSSVVFLAVEASKVLRRKTGRAETARW